MAIEFGAICVSEPDPHVVARATGLVLRASFGRAAPVDVDMTEDGWITRLGGAASVWAHPIPPGKHEFGDSWFLNVSPATRESTAWILAIVTAATSAELYGGRFVDEASLLRDELAGASDILVALMPTGGAEPGELLRRVRTDG